MSDEKASKQPLPNGADGADQAMALDFVLGALAPPEAEAAERRLAADPDFARVVGAMRQRLALLPEPIEPVAPPAELWDRIVARIDSKDR